MQALRNTFSWFLMSFLIPFSVRGSGFDGEYRPSFGWWYFVMFLYSPAALIAMVSLGIISAICFATRESDRFRLNWKRGLQAAFITFVIYTGLTGILIL